MPITGETTGSAPPVTAPLNEVNAAVRRGDSVRVDVVVRTRKVGHFFPGGTVDAFDTWVELKAVDDKGQTIFWSGGVADDGKGPVDPGAHFYRSLQVDEHGNPINKRNAWATRAVVYVHLIPPGAADTIHYRLKIPPERGKQDYAYGPHVLSQVLLVEYALQLCRRIAAGRQRSANDPGPMTIASSHSMATLRLSPAR